MHSAVQGMLLGLVLAIGLTMVDTLWSMTGKEGLTLIWRLLFGGAVGGLGGFVGGLIGQVLYSRTQLGIFLILGWSITGMLIGIAPGIFDLLARLAHDQPTRGPAPR